MKTMILLGSRNPTGQTAQAVDAVIRGLSKAGAQCTSTYLPTVRIERCRQCDENGWGLCRREGRCTIEDDFAGLVDGIRNADAVVFATPVYFGDLSESLKAFLDRLRRMAHHDPGKAGLAGKPAIGICVAGGGGGGSYLCSQTLERTLLTCGFAVTDMLPVRRQNLERKLLVLEVTGKQFGERPALPG